MRSTEVLSPYPVARPARHARVWLARDAWREHLCSSHDAHTLAALDRWIATNRPAVARRRDVGAHDAGAVDAITGDVCALAIALPLAQDRARVAFTISSCAVVRIAPPLRLDEVIASAPTAWQAALEDLVVRGKRTATSFRVYGSLAWQHIAGEACVTPDSDVDLLWAGRDASHIERTLELLVAWERESGLRADGELLLGEGDGAGSACAWRELLGGPARVLVKTDDGVAMRPSPLRAAQKSA